MRTHDMAKMLNELARILKSGQNVELKDIVINSKTTYKELNKEEIALNISTLLALSKIKKRTWVSFIEENRWPLEMQHRDSARNLIGKILKYLDGHPNALKKLKNEVASHRGQGSMELLNALSSLLDDNK